ncbi:MAG: ATP-grasp domain-containing protein, partial [Candidatus Delongbacteria bacterium]|nr:ATP-grasp domain-containing protein [Candidatus Delongbacteria bacterium]
AFQVGYSVEKIHDLTKIDKWFLFKMKKIVDTQFELEKYKLENITISLLKKAKQQGFSDIQISNILKSIPNTVREKRKELGIIPYVKQIDTMAAEYPAMTNYLYMTYNASTDDLDFTEKDQVVVLGGGAYRIGSSVEFDWCCVNANSTLRKIGYKTIMINYNPETVSTDYDLSDKLYFEELSLERVLDIFDKEEIKGVIVSMGGQIPNNLALPLYKAGIKILGTSPEMIDNAEDRHKFSELLDSLDIDQPDWKELSSIEKAQEFAEDVGYPVIIRPSYVLSGAAMSIVLNESELKGYLLRASNVNNEHPVVISKFIANAKEIEIDAVANNGELYCYAISGHVENAGVHSG